MVSPLNSPVSINQPRQPGEGFSNLGIGPDQVVVPETKVYRSGDGLVSRRYVAGDVISTQEAVLLGITPEVVGELTPVSELSPEAAIAFLRAQGYQVSPMPVRGPMDPIPTEEAIAFLQEQGFEVQHPADAVPLLEQPFLSDQPFPEGLVTKITVDGKEVEGTVGTIDEALPLDSPALAPAAKADPKPKNKREANPDNKAEKAPEQKS